MARIFVLMAGSASLNKEKVLYDVSQTATPLVHLHRLGHHLLFFSPGGKTPFFEGDQCRTEAEEDLLQQVRSLKGFQLPRALEGLSEETLLSSDGLFFPGGQGALALMEYNSVARVITHMHRMEKPIGAMGLGLAALLAVLEPWPFSGYAMTTQRDAGDLLRTLLHRKAVVSFAPKGKEIWVVEDRDLITAENAASARLFAERFHQHLIQSKEKVRAGVR